MEPEDSPAAASSYTKVLQGRYELGRVLGRGGSSKVYRARDIRSGVPVAVKAVRKPHHPCSPEMAAVARRSVEREISALRRVQGHPHVMRLLDVLASRSTAYLVLELARGGSLLSVMDERGHFDEPTARRLFVQLVSALEHVHSRGVFHRDVKPENLLLDEHGDLKLTDFGLCALADRHLGADGLAATRCGSPAYVAPEILFKKSYDAGKVDVWSSGVALFSLTAGYLPFNDGNLMGMYRKIFSGRFRCPRWFSQELRSLVGRMLDPDPGTRIKIREIMEHPWLQQDGTSSFGIIRAGSSDPRPEVMKWEAEMEQVKGLNAFDIIAFASGCDLTGLIGPLPDRVRFAVEGVDIGSVLDRAQEIGRAEGFAVRRKEEVGCGGAVFEAMGREIVAMVRVSRLLEQMLIVEVERASTSEPSKLWERLQLVLKFSNY